MKYFRSLFLLPLLYASHCRADFEDQAHTAIQTLQSKWYNSNNGLWNNLWWQSANMITTTAKLGAHDDSYKKTASDIVANTFAKSPNQNGAKNWVNDYFDDNGWWALAWIASYDLTGDSKYLSAAMNIFVDMTTGWNTPCGGGIWWDKKRTSIAAISNELFLSVAAHLANRSTGQNRANYLGWAQAEWNWFSNSGVINKDNLINDGIDKLSCKNDGKTTYTYNQGVILGALAELSKATGDSSYTDAAKKIADGTMNKLTSNGILTEPVQSLDEQGAQFKGVFVRGLAALIERAPEQRFKSFLKNNANSAWNKGRGSDGVIGPNWSGQAQGNSGTTSHASGVDLLVATAQST